MSLIGSSSGVRVAAAPLSNVYTVLLLVASLVLLLTLVAIWITTNQKYGVILPVSDAGKANMDMPDKVKAEQAVKAQKLQEKMAEIGKFQMDPGSGEPAKAVEAPAPTEPPAAPDAAAPAAAAPPGAAPPAAAPAAVAAPAAAAPAPAGEAK